MEPGTSATKLADEELIIVLHIAEAVSLNAAEAILMQASLSGNKLEAEPIRPGHTTLIDCNLVWETDRKSIKRMKTENLPVKVDCYALRNFKKSVDGATKDHVGYILFPIKNIPIIDLPKAVQMKPRWMKLIGLSKDWRQHKPELLLSIMITNKDFLTCDKTEVLETLGVEVQDSIVIEENPIPCMLSSQKGIFIRLLKEDGLLQVGNIDTDCDVFKVDILIKNIRFLENMKLLDEDHDFFINYVLLGNQHTRALAKKFNRIYQVEERVSINFRSSLTALREYFEKIVFIPFEIISGRKVFGASEIKLNELITTTSLVDFIKINSNSIHEMNGVCSIKTVQELQPNTNRPILEYKVKIHYLATQKLHQIASFEKYKRNQDVDVQAGGDFEIQLPKEPVNTLSSESRKQLSDISEVQSEAEVLNVVKAAAVSKSNDFKFHQTNSNLKAKPSMTQSEKADIESILKTNENGQTSELPRLFSYNLNLSSVQFNRKPEKGIWQFCFSHDKADTPRSIINREISSDTPEDNKVDFKEFELKLYFTSHTESIMEIIKSSELCKLNIKGPRGTHAEARLDCKSLLIGNKEQTSGIILLKDQVGEVTASANIFVYLDDIGINFNAQLKSSQTQFIHSSQDNQRSEMNITRTINEQKMLVLDESTTYKMIEELTEWKEQQQICFIDDLKQKELQFIERLKSEWIGKQAKYEHDLVVKADKLTSLTKSLQETHSNFKNKGNQQAKDEFDVQNYKQQLEKSFEIQLMAIKERARRMEDDLMHEIKLKDIRFEDIERCNEHLKRDNCELLQRTECLQAELKELKSNLVPKAEVEMLVQEMRLLKEKYETTEQAKFFYKEQWAKACRECHKMRRQNISLHKNVFFDEKCDRVCQVLDDDRYELDIEQEELDEIKRRLNLSDDD